MTLFGFSISQSNYKRQHAHKSPARVKDPVGAV